jgi:hypothetical protein
MEAHCRLKAKECLMKYQISLPNSHIETLLIRKIGVIVVVE